MPSIDKLENMTAESLDERQAEIDALLSLYTEQITKDYHACRLDEERLSCCHIYRNNKVSKYSKHISH